ncbi:MAG: hypothetical protein JWQ61_618 [Collimonas fungivorans]|nr:hypothetical protein [Collimonas fungivorans]
MSAIVSFPADAEPILFTIFAMLGSRMKEKKIRAAAFRLAGDSDSPPE